MPCEFVAVEASRAVRINPEKKEDRERVAQALLRVTLRLAAAHGFVSLGLREVSRAADIAPTSFYRHFADMEELGRALIETQAGPLIDGFVARARARPAADGEFALSVANEAIASAVEDPELMRFVLAERVGAIPTFRTALARRFAAVSAAVRDSFGASTPGAGPPNLALAADAVIVLVLAACAEVLDGGPGQTRAVTERVATQIRALLAGSVAGKRQP